MPQAIEAVMLFLMGLVGSLHCLGMCGGFALLAGRSGRFGPYAAGKTVTYAILGGLAGTFGLALTQISSVQTILGLVAGIALLVAGAATARLIPDTLAWTSITSRLGALLIRIRGQGPIRGPFLLGLVNGLLPCGLVYAALMKAMASTHPVSAGALMVAFGLGTLPALALPPLMLQRFSPDRLTATLRWSGIVIMIFGAVTIWRSMAGAGPMH